MAQEFKLPDLGEGVAYGDVVQVLVAEGDTVQPEQPVLEIETDKAVVEVPCPFGGRIAKLHVKKGDKVKVGQTLLTVEDNGAAAPAEAKAPQAQEAAKPAAPEPKAKPTVAEAKQPVTPESRMPATVQPPPPPPAKREPAKAAEPAPRPASEGEMVPAGPGTRRLARELGVELHEVAALKPGVRITEEDVKEFVKQRMTGGAPVAGGAVALPPLPDFAQWGPVERVALSSLQRKTAENLLASWVGPHVTQFEEVDITALEALRKRHRSKAGEGGVKLTVTAFVVKAAAAALKEFPIFNASYDPRSGELIYKRYYHIGVAVDTPAGLMVPVIRDVDRKRVLDIAAEMAELAERTRQRKVSRDEMRGGTFTVTNLGGIGGTAFTPIVNYPEVAILGMARNKEQPVVRDGQLATRLILPLCLSYDHRIINGADGARFIRKLASLLEDPEMLLLEA
ncbi:MAG TPA: 2-oxo acid dehydrogenase subunit E2 [Phycisphaerae bacterium]|nr:2-oxo acid dehydrogenase subunit E2 [Phycisphaerae bacterium]HOM50943.1 2-oxo acid dehydrogenase subunit E2 [Phycisphaerae bacterium]HON66684.1 2-oxo acid dehydrogenase subunit E2 [Phycisphaerae bacterium]HPP25828.1 2-oxo acid dehydrogenase subunit E2 [Phycisphaerae bacterium]